MSPLLGILIGCAIGATPMVVREVLAYKLAVRRDADQRRHDARRRYLEDFQAAFDRAFRALKDIAAADVAAAEKCEWRDRPDPPRELDDVFFEASGTLGGASLRLPDEEVQRACTAVTFLSFVIANAADADTTRGACDDLDGIWDETTKYVGAQLRDLAA